MIAKQQRIAIYCRLSKEDRECKESESIINQQTMLLKLAQQHGWTVEPHNIYIDDGFSGTNTERVNYERMINNVKSGLIDVILAKDLSRLNRNRIDGQVLTDYILPMHNVRLITILDGIDTDKDKGKHDKVMGLRHLFNEWLVAEISEKVRFGFESSAQRGNYHAAIPPIGYKKSLDDHHKLIIDNDTAPIVRRIFDLYESGISMRQIAIMFTNERIPLPTCVRKTRNDNYFWHDGTIKTILCNATYIGSVVNGKTNSISYKLPKRNRVPSDKWVVAPNMHEPIISRTQWDNVQALLEKNYKPRKGNDGVVPLFSGICKCKDCNASVGLSKKTKNNREYRYYVCRAHRPKPCTSHSITEDALTKVVLADILHYANMAMQDEQSLVDTLTKRKSCADEKEMQQNLHKRKQLQKRVDQLEHLSENAVENMIKHMDDDTIAQTSKKLVQRYDDEKQQLLSQIAQIDAQTQANINAEENAKQFVTIVKQCINLETLSRAVLLTVIDKIIIGQHYIVNGVKRQDIEIYYKYIGECENNA